MTDKPESTNEFTPHAPEGLMTATAHFDADEYRDDLAELDLTPEQETEVLQTLWNIMAAFVDLGWGVDNVQLFLPELFENVAQDSDKLLDSDMEAGEKT